jgi:oligosaccharide 4-alpha-D-glucosyltransferase
MTPEIQTTRDYSSDKLTVHYYADDSVEQSTGLMYEDDGESRTSLADGRYELLHFAADRSGDALTLELSRSGGEYDGMPAEREVTIVVHNWTSDVATVSLGGASVPVESRLKVGADSAAYDRDRQRLVVRLHWDHAPLRLSME